MKRIIKQDELYKNKQFSS